MTKIRIWLEHHGLERYADSFESNDIEPDLIASLTDQDLRELGVSLGHRKRLLAIGASDTGGDLAAPLYTSAAAAPPMGERRQLTILFVDLVGSTSLSVRYDPEDMQSIIERYQVVCGEVVRSYGGTVARYMGDGIMVYFGYPVASEFDSEYAIRAGLDMIDGMSGLTTLHNEPLQIRVGIATGDVVVGRLIGEGISQELEVTGETPNLASRLVGLAEPNTLVVGSNTRNLQGELFEFSDLGGHKLKGFNELKSVWQVVGEKEIESRFSAIRSGARTESVGRDSEVQQLQESWQGVCAGNGILVCVSGEPGIGKSHLVQNFRDSLKVTSYTPMVCSCAPHHQNSPFSPIIGMLRVTIGIGNKDTPQQEGEKLDAFAAAMDLTADVRYVFFSLLGLQEFAGDDHAQLSAPQLREATFAFIVDFIIARAKDKPLLLLFEDVHWIDPSTSAVIDRLSAAIEDRAVLLLLTYRTGFNPTDQVVAGRAFSIVLETMPKAAIRQMILNVADNKPLPEALVERIVEKTDGIPLFVEELTRNLIQSSFLEEREKRYELTVPLPDIAIPNTLQDALMARLDRAAAGKEVAQIAAVIGRSFLYEILFEVVEASQTVLLQALDLLTENKLVFGQGAPPEALYTFRHALVQDAAYSSLLKTKRREMHAKIAVALESREDNSLARIELLAVHHTQAGQLDRAVEYWHQAGLASLVKFSLPEAYSHLKQAIELNARLSKSAQQQQKELELRVHLGVVVIGSRGYAAPELFDNYTAAKALCLEMGDPPLHFAVIYGLWVYHLACSDRTQTLRYADEALQYATNSKNSTHELGAGFANGITQFYAGDLQAAGGFFAGVLESYEEERHDELIATFSDDLGLFTYAQMQWLDTLTGRVTLADEHFNKGTRLAERLADPMSKTRSSVFAMLSHHDMGDVDSTYSLALDAIEGGTASGFPFWSALGYCGHGWALAKRGDTKKGIHEIRNGLAFFDAIAQKLPLTYWMSYLAEALLLDGSYDEAEAVVFEAIAMSEKNTDSFYSAELHRLQGEILWQRDSDYPVAEKCFQTAIDMARQSNIKLHEIRAGLRLGQHWLEGGNAEQAVQLWREARRLWCDDKLIADIVEIDGLLAEHG